MAKKPPRLTDEDCDTMYLVPGDRKVWSMLTEIYYIYNTVTRPSNGCLGHTCVLCHTCSCQAIEGAALRAEVGYSSTFIFESCPGLDDPDLHTPRDDMGGPGSQRECPECMDMEQEFPLLTQGAAASAFEILEPIEPSKQ
jgi:hypothetical protein